MRPAVVLRIVAMGDHPKYSYPAKDELISLLRRYGQYGAASVIGCSRSALQHHLRKQEITAAQWRTPPKAWVPREKDQVGDLSISEEEILRQRVAELEKALRKDRKSEVMEERLIRAIEKAAASAHPVYNARTPKPMKTAAGKQAKSKKGKAQHEMVLLWSDTHAGEVVSKEETNGLNEYNWDIMWKRHHRMRESIYSYLDNRPYPIEKLHVLALGDMLSGNIHDELVATNEEPYMEVLADFAADGAAWLAEFGERFKEITFTGVVGNHPRAHRKPWAKNAHDNGDWLVYRYMRDLLKNNEQFTEWNIPTAAQTVVEICGKSIMALHGSGIRSSMPGIPWGGVARRVNNLALNYQKQANKGIDMFVLGHFHNGSFVTSDAGQIVLNGSVKGVDEYSLQAFGGGRPAQQFLLTLHKSHGVTDVSMLDLQEHD